MNTTDRRFIGSRVLIAAASLVVVVAGLKASQNILVPFVFSAFLSILGSAPLSWLRRLHVPTFVAVFLVGAVIVGGLSVIGITLADSVNEFTQALPRYRDSFLALRHTIEGWTGRYNIEISSAAFFQSIEPSSVMDVFGRTLKGLVAALSTTLLVVVLMLFFLFEAADFRIKLKAALGKNAGELERFDTTASEIQRYLGIKTITSAITGGLVGALVAIVGLDFVLLWGLVAFLFNYVPIVGSIIAAIPAVILALVELTPMQALLLAAGYLVINSSVSYLLEPILMGRSLGLSPLVVLLSLVFWGWLWGPVGMLMSIPLTMVLKILLEHSEDFQWIAILMGGRPRSVKN